MAKKGRLVLAIAILASPVLLQAAERPVAVSPGSSVGTFVSSPCPTFSWGTVLGAPGYELVVYQVAAGSDATTPALRKSLPGSASSWTPSLAQCFEPAGRYAWSVRVVGERHQSDWSPPNLFQVAAAPGRAEFDEALAVVRRYLAANDLADEEPPRRSTAAEPHRGTTRRPSAPMAPPETEMSVDGNIDATSYTGSGATLTDLDPAQIASGTAAIDVSGSSGDLACSGCVAASELDFDPATQTELDSHASMPNAHHTPSSGGTITEKSCFGLYSCTCSSGTLTGGGASCDTNDLLTESLPNSTTQWVAACKSSFAGFTTVPDTIRILCID